MAKIQVNPGTPITQGNNPWVDAVTYNAQWDKKEWIRPVQLKVNFLQPWAFHQISGLPTVQSKLADPTFSGWNPRDPVAQFPASVQQAYLSAYKAWSNVALIEAKPVKNPKKADVVFVLSSYNNNGYLSGSSGPQLQGSHEGLLRLGKGGFEAMPAVIPLISDANALVVQRILSPDGTGVAIGSDFFGTAIHEIGHGIGLSHPHDSGLGSVPSGVFPGLTPNDSFANYGTGLYALNQTPYTIMSYVRGLDDGSIVSGQSTGMTPMALDVMAAQLKYGVNQETQDGSDTYRLSDVFKLNTWQCIWDTGGEDIITGEVLDVPLVINLRPAEMNAVRPETGSPSERYDWGVAAQWAEALDLYLGLTASRMGFMLGSGVAEAYNLGYYFDQIISSNQPLWLEIQKEVLNPLMGYLSYLKERSFDYGDWSKVITTLAGGELEKLDSAFAAQASTAITRKSRSVLKVAAKAAAGFQDLKDQLDGIDEYVYNLPLDDYITYQAGLVDARATQNEIMRRSAEGVAGHVSSLRPQLYRSYANSGGFTIAAGVTIESAIGGQSEDEIIGNAADNRLFGLAGDDVIDGYLGNNLIDGGEGIDTAILFGSLNDYTFMGTAVNLIATNHVRGFENTLISIEAVKIAGTAYSPADLLAPLR
jgi:hypothetical protein